MKNFFEYYKSIDNKSEKRNLRNKIIDLCEIQHSTFYAWFVHERVSKLAQKIISQHLQKPQEELFPKSSIYSQSQTIQ